MKIKKSNPARRKSFRVRHNCDNPCPKTKARYWSCKKKNYRKEIWRGIILTLPHTKMGPKEKKLQ